MEACSSMMTSDTLPDILKELCSNQPLAVLATAADSAPYANLVAVAFTPDLRRLFFATSRTTRKWRNLTKNPQVSLLLDNRSNRIEDFNQAAAATILGTAGELLGVDREEGQNLYLARHPHLADFLTAPGCALFRVTIDKIYLVTRFQEVRQFDFSSH